jgi:AcrR family transcriptional regulator
MCPAPAKAGRPRDETLLARRQEEILDAAAARFAAHGYADTDVDSVAEDLQVGKGTVYRYFPSKRALFLAAVDRGLNLLMEAVDRRAEGIADPIDRMVEAIHAYLAYFEAHPQLIELFIQERAQFKDRPKPTYFAHRDANCGPWHELYRQMVAEGRFRDLPLDEDLDVLHDLMYGTILANHFANRRVPHERQAQNIVDIVFHGILTDPERKRRAKTPRTAASK